MKKLFTLLILVLGSFAAGAQSPTVTFSLVTQPCANNGVLQATASGLPGIVTYTFYCYSSVAPVQILATNTTGTLTNYSGGPVTVTATNGTSNAYGQFAGSPPFNYTLSSVTATCPAVSTASAVVTGGTAPFTIQWTPIGSNTVVATGSTVSLPQGGYSVLITDAAGCTYGSYAKGDSFQVSNNSGLTINATQTPAGCTNGTVTISSVTGGVAPYTYLWSTAANTSSISGLSTGYYYVTVTSAQGCSKTASYYVSQTINYQVNTTITNATCQQINGSATAFGNGGTSPYTYLWSNAQTSQTATGLTGNHSYSVRATDANGCISTGYAYINATTPINVTYSATASSCTAATGTATVTPTGGTAPYTTTWSTYPAQTGNTATGLTPGTYSFNVIDASGCARFGTVYVPPVSIVAGTPYTTNATCAQANGGASILVTGGSAPFTYSWSNSATTAAITGLVAGSYSVVVTDHVGCSITKHVSVVASSPISLGFNVTQATCIYSATGSVTATPTGGTAPYTYSWSNSTTTSTASSLATGPYYLTVHDGAGCVTSGYTYVPYNAANNSCYCTITGTVYDDLNANCTKDAGEPGIANIMVHAPGLGYAFTNANGVYSFMAPSGNYTLSESVQAYYPLAACQNNAQAVTVNAAANCTTTVNFANVINPIHDVSTYTTSFNGPPVPGNSYYQQMIVGNAGTVAESTILAGYKHDGQLGTPFITPGYFSGNGLNHFTSNSTFPAIGAGNSVTTYLSYTVPTNIPLNTIVAFNDSAVYSAPMSTWVNDYSPWNNVNAYSATVVGSFDPNYKEVSPKGIGPQGFIAATDTVLTYTIHFQNTGTYAAQKVVLVDSLSPNVNLQSLLPGVSNHTYKTSVTDGGVVTFTFDGINLPDSASQPLESIGYVSYSVHLKKGLAAGTQVQNNAHIYFDYNTPVKTNTTMNTTKAPTSVGTVAAVGTMSMSLYPNPAANEVAIALQSESDNGTAQIRFVNLVGQVMLQQSVSMHRGANLYNAAIGSLANGMYFVEISDGQRTATGKLSVAR